MTEANFTWLSLGLLLLSAVQPEAAAGAVFGAMFFWSLSPEIPIVTRFWLAIASVGFGYGTGLPAARSDSGWAWFYAGLGASLAHVVLVSVRSMVKKDGAVPPWLRSLLDLLPWTKTRGGDNES